MWRCNCTSHHDDDTDEQVGEDEVAEEEEGDGEELTTLEPVQGELVLKISPPIRLQVWRGRGRGGRGRVYKWGVVR